MSYSRLTIFALLVISSLMVIAGCSESENEATFDFMPIYSDGSPDKSAAVAQVGDFVITEKMLQIRYDELPPKFQARYVNDEGQMLLLNVMIEETIMVMGAVREKLYNDAEVARTLHAQRRITLDSAMRNVGLLKDKEPNDDQIRDYFLKNKDKYRRIDTSKGRHVECLTRDDANKAYERLVRGGANNNWPHVVNDLSVNEETSKRAGEFGWFNKGSFLPQMDDEDAFTAAAIKMDLGINEPVLINNHWHVIEILKREFSRTMTFSEARAQVKMEMMGGFHSAIIKDYLRNARKELNVTLLGEFAPGKGLSAEEIFNRGMLIADEVEKIDMLSLVFEDYPGDERADDALFWAASAALDAWEDRSVGRRYLEILMLDYPDSELAEQAQFLLDNMDNPKAFTPGSIEELRNNIKKN